MSSDVSPITVEAVPRYTGLDGENAENYYRASQRSAFLFSEVTGPFSSALKESLGYDKENIPDSEKEVLKNIGRHSFLLKARRASRRPSYKDVFDETYGFLDTRLREYKSNERPVGVLTINGKPYILLENVISNIEGSREVFDLDDVDIFIAERPELPDVSSMVVPLGIEASELNQSNAARYLEACSLRKLYNDFMFGFESDLIGLTGFDNDNPPENTEHMYRHMGNHIFHVRTTPYQSTKWSSVIQGLVKDPPKRKPENGGDLTLIERGIEVPRLEIYDVRLREYRIFLKLEVLITRMEELKDEFTSTNVRQRPINHYPLL